jgi:hypothetical protein
LLGIPKQFQFLLLALPGDFHLLQHVAESGPNLLDSIFTFSVVGDSGSAGAPGEAIYFLRNLLSRGHSTSVLWHDHAR